MENDREWFSSRVRLVARIDGSRASHWMDCVHVFRAADWDSAFARALALGRAHEEKYRNADGATVTWKLAEVISLDLLRSDDLEGAEVYSELTEIAPDAPPPLIAPEQSTPTQTLS